MKICLKTNIINSCDTDGEALATSMNMQAPALRLSDIIMLIFPNVEQICKQALTRQETFLPRQDPPCKVRLISIARRTRQEAIGTADNVQWASLAQSLNRRAIL